MGRMLIERGERFSPQYGRTWELVDHLSRYQFASSFADGRRVLDDGCGYGYGSYLLAGTGSSVVGIDAAPMPVQYARRVYRAQNLAFSIANGAALPFRSGSFDLVVSLEVIEHLTNASIYLSEARRVLTPGGMLVLSTPNREVTSPTSRNSALPFHEHEFEIDELREEIEILFEDVEVLGKRITNERFQAELERIAHTWRRIALDRLVWLAPSLVREVGRLAPAPLKRALLPQPKSNIDLDDVEITRENVDLCNNMIILARARG